jgi:hypothetical protein
MIALMEKIEKEEIYGEMRLIVRSETKEIVERALGVVMEHFEGKVQLIAEQLGDVQTTLDLHTQILESHAEMIGILIVDVEILKEDMIIVKTDLREVKADLKNKADKKDVTLLVRRVTILEKK